MAYGYSAEAREAPNDPKLSDRDPEARVCAKRREAKARHVPGFMAGAHAVTEPVESTAALRQLNARVAVRCSAWLGVSFISEVAAELLQLWRVSPRSMKQGRLSILGSEHTSEVLRRSVTC